MQKFSRSAVAEGSFGSAASGRSNVGCLDSDWPLTGGRYVSEGSRSDRRRVDCNRQSQFGQERSLTRIAQISPDRAFEDVGGGRD